MAASEDFVVVALPHSANPEADFHVSLFVSPRLEPTRARGHLDQFPHFISWPDTLAAAEIRLIAGTSSDGTGGWEIAVTALPESRATAWKKVFPPDTLVIGRPEPQLPNDILSYPAGRIDSVALNMHSSAILQEPLDLPRPLGTGFREIVARQIVPSPRFDYSRLEDLNLERLLDPDSGLQASFTRLLDAAAERVGENAEWSGLDLDLGRDFYDRELGLNRELVVGPGGLDEQLLDVHRARRYYETLAPPASRPRLRPPVPETEFHARCGLLAGTPALLRRLGLVVDLRVDDLAALAGITWIRAQVSIDGLARPPAPANTPRTGCSVDGTGFFAAAESDDWSRGWLRLAHPDGRFTVLDLDPDASALNVERHWRNLVRLAALERNGDAPSAAPQSLRAEGFSIARNRRAEQLRRQLELATAHAKAREQGDDLPLTLEEVTRGLRFEVWDDVSQQWHSLHERRVDITANGDPIETALADVGYLKGGTLLQNAADDNAPAQLHEVITGWQGWSLSAPPPGNLLLADNEVGETPASDPVDNPVQIKPYVAPGTLPRLRYGRSYAFRAIGVDLAGNSAPHPLGETPTPNAELVSAVAEIVARRGEETAVSHFAEELLAKFREARPPGGQETRGRAIGIAEDAEITGHADLDRLIRSRSAARAERLFGRSGTRLARLEYALTEALHESERLVAPTGPELDPAVAARLLGPLALSSTEGDLLTLVEQYLDFVTEPRPFLRWQPLLPPTVVPRHPYSAGESALTLVIRSGVEEKSPELLEITEPGAYASANPALPYRSTSERHIAPPKVSQREAELHGKFDAAIASGDAATRRKALAAALREEGTLLDPTIADLENPGKRIKLTKRPQIADPSGGLTEITAATKPERGDALPAGSYVIHDVDQLILPYLPDPMASGFSFVFPGARPVHGLSFPWAVEGLRLDYRKSWPEPQPYRLVLDSGERLEGRVDGNAVRIAIPPGEQLRVRLSSALGDGGLDRLGLWRTRPDSYRKRAEIAGAARDGWMWWLTPFDEVRLVHAVQRPVEVPRAIGLDSVRSEKDSGTGLKAVIEIHGASTGRIDVEAEWSEPIDDPTAETPADREPSAAQPADHDPRPTTRATAWGTEVESHEDFLVLVPAPLEAEFELPEGEVLQAHLARHELGDTKHRLIDYKVRATTRYQEHFEKITGPTLGKLRNPATDDLSVVSAPIRVSVPSSSRPPKPVIHDVLPLFRWQEGTGPGQPFATRHTRRSGIRIYLERPWYATGEGELLGVVLASGRGEPEGVPVSIWAADPVWAQNGPADRGSLPLRDILEVFEPAARDEPGRPVGPPALLPAIDSPARPEVLVLGYRPEYNSERKLWFVDIAFDQGSAFWPFVRLVLARYQPASLDGLHLSPLVTADFAQLAPDRIATLSRPDDRSARVVVSGPVGYPLDYEPTSGQAVFALTFPFPEGVLHSRRLRARLERRDPQFGGSDLGWTAISEKELELRHLEDGVATWLGQLSLPRALAPRLPGTRPNWRVTVEEWERLRADSSQRAPSPGHHRPIGPAEQSMRTEARLIYADHLYL